jgi:hypothetical protein
MDKVFTSWLERQNADAMALAESSDILRVAFEPLVNPPRRFIAQFRCPTLVKAGGEVVRAEGFAVGIQFPADYLRCATDPVRIVQLLDPPNAFHPNVAPPFVCIGHVAPGTALCELIYQVHEILTFNKLTPREDDALSRDACAWARRHMHLFPLSTAPLRRRAADFHIDEISSAEPRDGIAAV